MLGKWKKIEGRPNYTSQRRGFFISYNPGMEHVFNDWHPTGETAIVVKDRNAKKTKVGNIKVRHHNAFYILAGDHREAYDKLATIQECVQYFYENYKFWGFWTNELLPHHAKLVKNKADIDAERMQTSIGASGVILDDFAGPLLAAAKGGDEPE